ncbi:riboflavin-binding protein-like, partial [Dendronephthya gigantea]|uniref:riboflavin-binding protein-like n=1 Tax=Dendronephthya gigantea TaxID=151771 RepID=UPI00106A0930
YSCEPRLYRWHTGNATIKNVPICGDYCDSWYEACKDDETCIKNWLIGFDTPDNTCPKDAKCQTFKEMYGSGKEVCNKMWGTSFRYVDPKCPCSRMDQPIPSNVDETSTCSGGEKMMASFYGFYLIIFMAIKLS